MCPGGGRVNVGFGVRCRRADACAENRRARAPGRAAGEEAAGRSEERQGLDALRARPGAIRKSQACSPTATRVESRSRSPRSSRVARSQDVTPAELSELVRRRQEQAVERAPTLSEFPGATSPMHWFENYNAANSRAWLVWIRLTEKFRRSPTKGGRGRRPAPRRAAGMGRRIPGKTAVTTIGASREASPDR